MAPGGSLVMPTPQPISGTAPLRPRIGFGDSLAAARQAAGQVGQDAEGAAGWEQIHQDPKLLCFGRVAGAARQEAPQVARVAQELVQELAAQQQVLRTEPRHEERQRQRDAADERQDPRQRQRHDVTLYGIPTMLRTPCT